MVCNIECPQRPCAELECTKANNSHGRSDQYWQTGRAYQSLYHSGFTNCSGIPIDPVLEALYCEANLVQ